MAKEILSKRVRSVVNKQIKKIGFTKGLPGPIVADLVLGGAEIQKNYIPSFARVISSNAFTTREREVLKKKNNKKFWISVVREVHSLINKRKMIGNNPIRGYNPDFNKTPFRNGIFYGDQISSKKGFVQMKLMITDAGVGDMDKVIQNIYKEYVDLLYEVVTKKLTKDVFEQAAIYGTNKEYTRPSTSTNKLRTGTLKDHFKTGIATSHADTTTKGVFMLRSWQNPVSIDGMQGTTYGIGGADDFQKEMGIPTSKKLEGGGFDNTPISFNIPYEYIDISQHLESAIGIDFSQTARKKAKGKYQIESRVKLFVGKNPGGLETDAAKISNRIISLLKNNTSALRDIQNALSISRKGSKPLKKQIAEDVALDLIRPLTKKGKPDMRFKVNKKSGKKFKASNKEGRAQKPKPTKRKRKSVSVGGTAAISIAASKGKEKGSRRVPTGAAAQYAKIKQEIQRKLPEQVKKNMGRPALENQKGGFASSVRLVSLTPAANSVVAKYTYTLTGGGTSKNRTGVYSTFENSGRWPTGYNPKPLISKSIRELAKKAKIEQLTTRRV